MDITETLSSFAEKNNIKIEQLTQNGLLTFSVEPKSLPQLLSFLKESKKLRFTILTDLFGADFPERDRRFEVVYSLLSLQLNKRIWLKTFVAEDEMVPSVASIFSAACWYEREIFDMYGIVFSDAPDLRRILTDYGFKGHPLRKDFPLTGHVEVRYDEKLKEVIYEPVTLDQEFRNFDFVSPWQGPGEYVLPGDEKATKN